MLIKTLWAASVAVGAGVTMLVSLPTPVSAFVVFDNTNNLNTTTNGGYNIAVGRPVDQAIGLQFTPTRSGTLSQIDVFLLEFASAFNVRPPSTVAFSLFTDNANTLGSSLVSFNVTLNPAPAYYSVTNFSTTPHLIANTPYWLVANHRAGHAGWGIAAGAPERRLAFGPNPIPRLSTGYANRQEALFRVSVTADANAVPVPPQFLATLLGASAGILKLRAQRHLN
jgi:hypothetical protein